MLFDEVIARQKAALEAYFADPTRHTLVLRVEPDLEFVAARFVALLGAHEHADEATTEPPVVFGASAPFTDVAGYYREIAAQIHESVAELAKVYLEEDPDLVLPEAPLLPGGGEACIEAHFAAYLETITRGLGNWHATTVFVLRFETDEPRLAHAAAVSLAKLGGYLVMPEVKLVVFDDRGKPRLPALRSVCTRYTADAIQPGRTDLAGRLERFVRSDDKRVLGLHCRGHHPDELRRQLSLLRGRGVATRLHWVEAPFEGRTNFCDLIYRCIATGAQTPPPWVRGPSGGVQTRAWAPLPEGLPESVHDLRALERPEQSMVELVERVAARQGGGPQCIVVRPTSVHDRALWRTFVAGLVGACARIETKFIVLDVDGVAPFDDAPPVEQAWAQQSFSLETERTGELLAAVLARPDLAPDVRIGHMLMLANFEVGQGQHLQAAERAASAVELAEAHAVDSARSSSWWTLGYALQRAGNTGASRNAFTESCDAALQAANPTDAANALMGIGHTYYLEKQWSAAIATYEAAREQWLDAGQVFGECQALIWSAEAYRKVGLRDDAERRFAQVEAKYRAMKAPFEAMARGGLADLYERMAANHNDAGHRAKAHAYSHLACQHGSCGPVPDRPL
ncbi:MAG: tetratricopeptide repeat protein [Deltaproteobacteria bacterium]|nr:tetratricopeptide repeat protein [Deltaproteobacteria bacterium]